MNNNDLTLKLDRARWYIMQHQPFYGSLMMSLVDVVSNPHGKTACVDGRRIFWDAEFLGKLSEEETRYVLLHETLHCAHGHLWRFPAGKVDHPTGNIACDHAINLILNAAAAEGFKIKMPVGGLADRQFVWMAEEEIYNVLASNPQRKHGQNDPCGDFCEPAKGVDPASGAASGPAQITQEDWQRKVIQAAQAAKASGKGNIPADMSRQLADIAAVKIDWRQETAEFVRNTVATKNDWTRGNRRMLWQSVMYPSRRRDNIGLIIGVRDTSGSIDDAMAAQFSAILGAACAELGAELLLLDCDTDIQAEYRVSPGDIFPLKAAGGGGTDFAAPFARTQELIDSGESVAGLIYLTDLCGGGWPLGPAFPVLCLCTEDRQAPSGRTVKI